MTNCANEERSLTGLETAWQLGARLYDTADVYGHGRSERLLGRLVEQVPRHEVVLASTVGYFAGTAEHGDQRGDRIARFPGRSTISS